eukprot:87325-Prorocentrum_minimum.AAC.1
MASPASSAAGLVAAEGSPLATLRAAVSRRASCLSKRLPPGSLPTSASATCSPDAAPSTVPPSTLSALAFVFLLCPAFVSAPAADVRKRTSTTHADRRLNDQTNDVPQEEAKENVDNTNCDTLAAFLKRWSNTNSTEALRKYPPSKRIALLPETPSARA